MGEVIGPLHWTIEDRQATWLVMRDLRSLIKARKAANDNTEGTLEALGKEETYYKEQFSKWTHKAAA